MHPDTFPPNPNHDPVRRLDDSIGFQGEVSPDTGIAAEADFAAASEAGPPSAQPDESREGKHVFKPHELNQSGEDKEYFHPDKHRKFDTPKDANDHALTPDVEITPGNKVKPIR